jgi:hypothetical protein
MSLLPVLVLVESNKSHSDFLAGSLEDAEFDVILYNSNKKFEEYLRERRGAFERGFDFERVDAIVCGDLDDGFGNVVCRDYKRDLAQTFLAPMSSNPSNRASWSGISSNNLFYFKKELLSKPNPGVVVRSDFLNFRDFQDIKSMYSGGKEKAYSWIYNIEDGRKAI